MRLRVCIERERVLVQSFGMRGPALNAGNCDTYMIAGSKPLSRGAGKSRAGAIFEWVFDRSDKGMRQRVVLTWALLSERPPKGSPETAPPPDKARRSS